MKLKGHVKLTIRDESGKIIRTEEDHNTITPALMKIFSSNLSGTVDFTKLTPILTKLLGGVCLWNGTLDENSVYLPKQTNAQLIAHAGQNQTGGLEGDSTKGELDTNEQTGSGPVENGYRWVWRWNESQGNGRISGLTLCHADVGDFYHQIDNSQMPGFYPVEDISNYALNANSFTYSDASPAASNLPQVVGITLPHSQDEPIHGLDKIPVGFYDDLNHVVSLELVETSETDDWRGGKTRAGQANIYISKFTGNGLWLWNALGDLVPEEEKTITVNLAYWQWANFSRLGRCIYYIAYDPEIKHFYFLTLGTLLSSTWYPQPVAPYNDQWISKAFSINIIDIDLETGQRELKSIDLTDHFPPNMTPFCFRIHEEQYDPMQLKVVNGKLILPLYDLPWKVVQRYIEGQWVDVLIPDWDNVPSYTNRGIRLDLRTPATVDLVQGYMEEFGGNSRSSTACLDLGNERIMFPNALIERTPSSSGSGFYTNNFRSRTIPRLQTLFGTAWRTNRTFTASRDGDLVQHAITTVGNGIQGNKIRGAILNKMYQASVFRLNSIVEKQTGQTMTVEYTILQEQEAQE